MRDHVCRTWRLPTRPRCVVPPLIRAVILFVCLWPGELYSQDSKIGADSTGADPKRDWNEADLGFTTARVGVAVIHEYATYSQDDEGEAQMDSAGVVLEDAWKFRDFRFFANGRLNTERPLIWKVAAMHDGVLEEWTFRETGLIVGIPELHSEVFIGRQKEGYSLNKVQNGYSTWGNERQMSLDVIPIMTDGIRWYGYLPKPRFLWSAGAFTDLIYEDSKFATWDWQFSGRVGWRPIYTDKFGELLHLGVNMRYARPDEGKFQVRSKPESSPAPYFVDTGVFHADRSTGIGGEAYYSRGRFLTGTEFNWYSFDSGEAGDPTYFGGDVVVSYMFTSDRRPYLSNNSVFFFVEPEDPLFSGGPGAWELVLRYSTYDLNEGRLPGGKFWKITPMVNWYVSNNFRLELVYGYGVLDRFDLEGGTHFFQTRIMFLMD